MKQLKNKPLKPPKSNKAQKYSWLTVSFSLGVAAILVVSLLAIVIAEYLFVTFGVVGTEEVNRFEDSNWFWVIILCVMSLGVGITFAVLFSKFVTDPLSQVMDGMSKLRAGDYKTRVKFGKITMMKEVEDNFNTLACELENTEMLRSDFVNDFSHELKTPIASVSSLVHLLKNEKLPLEKRKKYLEIIEEEINRIAGMTTNILNLSKIENQGILTGESKFNVSEQIRTCVLLLEKNWVKKKLNLVMDFDEYEIRANEDMLKQVWFNLLDNAIKFSDPKTDLKIMVEKVENNLAVSVSNHGVTIKEEDYSKIFTKFYRADKLGKDGNGIGLSIVKHIVELHKGDISVESKSGLTTFTVLLPCEEGNIA